MAITAIMCMVLAVICFLLDVRQNFDRSALEDMADAVRNGESVSDAIVAFCRDFVNNAQMS